jgi:hypothetical protein
VLGALVVVLALTQVSIVVAGAVVPGRNGVLLIHSPQTTQFGDAHASPAAGVADCSLGTFSSQLWTVRPSGRGLARVTGGNGDTGEFSPDGRALITSWDEGCGDGGELYFARTPFHRETPIPHGELLGAGLYAAIGPWLGPGQPTFFEPDSGQQWSADPQGTYRNAITGRALFSGDLAAGPMSCSGRVANSDGTIGTPERAARGVSMSWRQIRGRGWLGDPGVTVVQWSPDGRYVYFTTRTRRSDSLWRVDADGTGRRLLFRSSASDGLLSQLAPDGKWILLTTRHGAAGHRLSVITSAGRELHAVTPPVRAAGNLDATGQWSPRGDLLLVSSYVTYYSRNPIVSTPTSFYVVHPEGGPRHRVSIPSLALSPVWSPDERFIAFTTVDAGPGFQGQRLPETLHSAPVGGGPPARC